MADPSRSQRRALGTSIVALLGAALALWASARLVWSSASVEGGLRGAVVTSRTGGELAPALGPFALLALAAVAAAVATGGAARRALGAVLALAGAALAWLGISAAAAAPDAVAAPGAPTVQIYGGRLLVLVAAAAVVTAGALLAARGHRMPRLGARYQVPAARDEAATAAGGAPGPGGAPPAGTRELWDSLDAGTDPTADPR